MTTITIDAPLNIKKTHFATARDAAEFLLKYVEKEQKKIGVTSVSKKLQRTQEEEQVYKTAKNNTHTIALEKKHVEDYALFQKLIMSDG